MQTSEAKTSEATIVITAKGFCYYGVVEMGGVTELDGMYKVAVGKGDIWISKNDCEISDNSLTYITPHITVHMEQV